MKKICLFILMSFCSVLLMAQLNDTESTNNGSMTLGNGTGTFYQFAGAQRGTDGTNQSQGGYGILSGSNQISPIIWMYGNGDKNAFQVRRKSYNGTVQNGKVLFHLGANDLVGIGTNNPTEKLQLEESSAGQNVALRLRAHTEAGNGRSWYLSGDPDGRKFHIGEEATSSDFVMDQNGNIGIGTNNPNEKLDVNGKVQADYLRLNAGTSTEGGELRLDGPNGYNEWKVDNRLGNYRLHHSGTTHFQVNQNGATGIGTTSIPSGYKLAVDGKAIMEEVKVELSGTWPDYVFEPTYDLKSLEEIEQYIQSNKHLPEIPSAKEMEANGVKLGEMNMLLLKKIEELTLHTIEQEKKLNAYQQYQNEMMKLIASLQEELESLRSESDK